MDLDMTWSWLVLSVILGEAKVLDALFIWPAFALWLPLPATQSSKMVSRLHTEAVLVLVVAHAVNRGIIRLDTHTGTIIFDPIAGLAAPAVTPVW
jgi:hypothetical protein